MRLLLLLLPFSLSVGSHDFLGLTFTSKIFVKLTLMIINIDAFCNGIGYKIMYLYIGTYIRWHRNRLKKINATAVETDQFHSSLAHILSYTLI